jgi:hypothetical protein
MRLQVVSCIFYRFEIPCEVPVDVECAVYALQETYHPALGWP